MEKLSGVIASLRVLGFKEPFPRASVVKAAETMGTPAGSGVQVLPPATERIE